MSVNLTVYVGPYVTVTTEKIPWDDFCRKHGEHLARIDTEDEEQDLYLLPNHEGGVRYDRYSDNVPKMVGATTISAEMEKFEEQYAETLAALRKEYGTKNVRVRYGVVPYWM